MTHANGYKREFALPIRRQTRRNGRSSVLIAAAAALLVAAFGLVRVVTQEMQQAALVQVDTALLPNDLQPIRADNVAQLELITTLGNGINTSADWSPDGETIAVGGARGIWLYDTADIESDVRLIEMQQQYMPVQQVGYNSDGSQLVVADNVGNLHVYDADMNASAQIVDVGMHIYDFVFTPDGTQILAGVREQIESDESSSVYTGYVVALDLTTMEVSVVASGESDPYQIALSPDGRMLAFISRTEVLLHDMATGERRQLEGTFEQPGELSFSPDGATLLVGTWLRVSRYDVATGDSLGTIASIMPTGRGAFAAYGTVRFDIHPNGEQLAVADDSGTFFGTFYLFDTPVGEQTHSFNQSALPSLRQLLYNPDGTALLGVSDVGIVIADVTSGEVSQSLQENNGATLQLALNEDSDVLAVGEFGSNALTVWSLATGESKRLAFFDWSASPVTDLSLALNADGSRLLVGSSEGVQMFDVSTGEVLWTTREWQDGFEVGFADEDNFVVGVSTAANALYLWEAQTGFLMSQVDFANDFINARLSGENALLLSNTFGGEMDDQQLGVWSILTGRQTAELVAPEKTVDRIIFSGDGNFVALSQGNSLPETSDPALSVDVWDWYREQLVATLRHEGSFFLQGMAFLEEGELFLTIDQDHRGQMLRLWSIDEGALVHERALGLYLSSLQMSADDKLMITGSYDGLIRIWGVRGA